MLLAACSTAIDSMPSQIGGLAPGTPERRAVPLDYMPVGEAPPARDAKLLSEADRKKLEADLVAERERAAARGGVAPEGTGKPARKKEAAKGAKKDPAKSSAKADAKEQ